MAGWLPVLAHPERYANAAPDLSDAAEWRRMGAALQVNAGSLLGRYGKTASALAWGLVEHGLAAYLSSDYHARGRCAVAECRAELERRGGEHQARLLLEENPRRMLEGEPPLPVPPLSPPRPFWKRILRLGRVSAPRRRRLYRIHVRAPTHSPFRAPRIVPKPWGREVWYAHEDRYAGKIIEVNAGFALSLQKHERKQETMYLQSGRLTVPPERHGLRDGAGRLHHHPPGRRAPRGSAGGRGDPGGEHARAGRRDPAGRPLRPRRDLSVGQRTRSPAPSGGGIRAAGRSRRRSTPPAAAPAARPPAPPIQRPPAPRAVTRDEVAVAREALRLRAWALAVLGGGREPPPAAGSAAWRLFLAAEGCALALQRAGAPAHPAGPAVTAESTLVLAARMQMLRIDGLAASLPGPVVVLKGGVAAAGAEPVHLSDVDVLVPAGQAASLGAALERLGHAAAPDPPPGVGAHHLGARQEARSLAVEVHFALPALGDEEGVLGRSVPLEGYRRLRRPAPPDHLRLVLVHAAVHHPERRGRLRDLLLAAQALRECAPAEAALVRARAAAAPFGAHLLATLDMAEALAAGRAPRTRTGAWRPVAYLMALAYAGRGASLARRDHRHALNVLLGGAEERRALLRLLRAPTTRASALRPLAAVERAVPALGGWVRVARAACGSRRRWRAPRRSRARRGGWTAATGTSTSAETRFIADLAARRASPEPVARSPRAPPRPARPPWRGAPGFPGDVGNGGRMEARQGAIRIFSGNPIVSGAPRSPPFRLLSDLSRTEVGTASA